MIRYNKSLAEIKKEVTPKWLAEAKRRTAKFRKDKRYSQPPSPNWSDVKTVFIRLQNAKCAYCEKKLESGTKGKIEWDVEHYRPKAEIKPWPPASRGRQLAYPFSLGPASNVGYYLLPYDLLNYLAACKTCNTPYKSSYFPIGAKKRLVSSTNMANLRKEKPFLPYPIGNIDDDPEEILTFQSYVCVPSSNRGHKRNRALVTIDFFELNGRDTLLEERAELILALSTMLQRLEGNKNDEEAALILKRVRSGISKHANCGRSFLRAYKANRPLAAIYVKKAKEYLESKSK